MTGVDSKPWMEQHYFEGDEVLVRATNRKLLLGTVIDTETNDHGIMRYVMKGTVVGAKRNKFGRINYIVEFDTGKRDKVFYEDITGEKTEKKRRDFLSALDQEYREIRNKAAEADESTRSKLLSDFEQLKNDLSD